MMPEPVRIVSTDPGLLTHQQLLATCEENGRRKSYESYVAKQHSRRNLVGEGSRLSWNKYCREHIKWFLDSARLKVSYDDFMTVATLFVLFGDWIRTLSFSPSADSTFSFLNNCAFFLFLAEIIMNSWAKSDFSMGCFHVRGYMFNFFFWLDLLCIVSMIPDLKWISSNLGMEEMPGTGVGAKAGKAGKIGAKTGRVVRMVRLLRLVKLYKITSQRQREKKIIEDLGKLVEMGHIQQDDLDYHRERRTSSQKQSKVGAELSDIITRRVIVAVLMMLLVVPLLSYSSTIDDEREATDFLQSINVQSGAGSNTDCNFLVNSTINYVDFLNNILETADDSHQYLIDLAILPNRCDTSNVTVSSRFGHLDHLRQEEIKNIQGTNFTLDGETYSVQATFNMKYFKEQEAKSGIYTTLFVVFMLISLSSQFTGDAQKLVLAPIENMMEMVNMVADDPLQDYDFNALALTSEYETRVVQVAIQKITALLRVGFGVAGAEIISTNMAVEGEDNAVLEPMIPGKRIYAIFGFCDIHAFDLCTEKLEDEIMTFVNSVARIVHDEVTRWGGLCNKNLGNAFLMVWRIGDEAALQDISGRRRRKSQRNSLVGSSRALVRNLAVDLRRIPGLDIMADKALIGFLKVIVEVNRDKQVIAYRNDARLIERGEYFKLRMGFGLHAGWAIEGAVGSLQKVDATYLSPHVNMAARMEAASRQFGVCILMSERFVELMSSEAQRQCRKLDVVTVKGSAVPMPIYTFDTFQNQIFPQLRTPKYSSLDLEEVLKKQADEYDVLMWKHDQDLIQLRSLSTETFRESYRQGLESYLSGEWEKARIHLTKANDLMMDSDIGGDGPSKSLLSFMESREWNCPREWKGFRPLTSK